MNISPVLKIIGVVHSTLKSTQDSPPGGNHGNQEAILEIFPDYCMGLAGMEQMSQLMVLYWLRESDREVLRVYPNGDRNKELLGVFCNRSPLRPNPIGVSVVDILEIGIRNIRVRGLDAINGTPIIDIKAAPE